MKTNSNIKKQQRNGHGKVMTVKEVSELLRLPVSTIYALARKGKIRGMKFGKHWRFVKEEIEVYLRGNWAASGNPVLLSERRKYPRLKSQTPAQLSMLLTDERVIEGNGILRNLSEGGVFFVPATELEVGDPVKLVFTVQNHSAHPLVVEGRVVHRFVHPEPGVGIKFRNLSKEDQGIIQDYVG